MADPVSPWFIPIITACGTACVNQICPRLCSCLSDVFYTLFPGLRSNRGQTYIGPSPGDQTNTSSSPEGQKKTGPSPEDLMNAGSSQGGQMNSGLIMIIARDLKIEYSENTKYWDWVHDPRFKEVAELLEVWWFLIETRINFLALSANTKYGAYLIFRIKENSTVGLDTILKASVSVGGTKFVCLKPTTATPLTAGSPVLRSDGWMELELGQFKCDNVTGDKEAVISIKDENEKKCLKKGLIVAGIEVRPI